MKIRNRIVASMMTTVLMTGTVFSASPFAAIAQGLTEVGNLTVNYLDYAAGIETDKMIRFGWNMTSDTKGEAQKSYKIDVYENSLDGAFIWTSGEVKSSRSTGVAYNIEQLRKETKYAWTVTVVTEDGEKIVSDTDTFITDTDLSDTNWIIPVQNEEGVSLLRTEQGLKNQKIQAAYLYISSLGTYTAYIDGQKVKIEDETDDILNPGWTDYKYYTNYQTYDVTGLIQDKTLTMGVEVGKGWYAGKIGSAGNYETVFGEDDSKCELGLIAKLVINYENGTRQIIKTDKENWKSSVYSPVVENDLFDGESYDANIAQDIQGWNNDNYFEKEDEVSVLNSKAAMAAQEVAGKISDTGTDTTETQPETTEILTEAQPETAEILTEAQPETAEFLTEAQYAQIETLTEAVEMKEKTAETNINAAKNIQKASEKESDWEEVTTGTYSGELRSGTKAITKIADEYDRNPVNAYIYKDSETLSGQQAGNDYGSVTEHAVNMDGSVSLKAGDNLIIDFGQNGTGAVELTVNGAKDTTVTIDHSEMLNDGRVNKTLEGGGSDGPKGSLYKKAITNAEVKDTYKLSNEGTQTFLPTYTFRGFRYAKITADQDIQIKNAVAKVYTSTGRQTGYIETSNSEVNQLFSNTLWSQKSNYLSIPTDCPQRGERAGWTGDAQLFAATGVYTYDVFSFLENYSDIMQEHAKNNDNKYGSIMPTSFVSFFASMSASGWSDAGVIIPWVLYQQTGDTSFIESYYSQMDGYMDAIEKDGYNSSMFGDWLAFSGASTPYLNAVYQIYCTDLMKKMAGVLGNQEAIEKYNSRYDTLKAGFMEKYVDKDGNVLSASADNATVSFHGYEVVDNAQTAILWALKCGLYESESQRDIMIANLLKNIKNEGGTIREGYDEDTLSVGFLGVNVILPVLTDIGASDTAYDLLLQDSLPSWLYSVKNGATTIWERWNSYSIENSFGDSSMNSFNHYSYGACVEWMFKYMGGITMDEENPGFQKMVLQPTVDESGRITFVNSSYDSQYGTIVSNWKSKDGKMSEYEIELPANTSAALYLDVSKETAEKIAKEEGITFEGMTTHHNKETALFYLVSGNYQLTNLIEETPKETEKPAESVKVSQIKMNQSTARLFVKDTVKLSTQILPSNAKDKSVTWSSSKSSIVKVDQKGKVTAVKAGTAVITVTSNDGSKKSATCKITVVKPTVKLNVKSTKLQVKKSTKAIKASGLQKGDQVVKWTSSKKSVATVNKSGKITAKKAGTTTITVRTKKGASASMKLTVQKTPVKTTSIKAGVSSIKLKKGKTSQIKITRKPVTAVDKITYTSSSKSVAAVSKSGKITAKKKGRTTITIQTSNHKIAVVKVIVI